MGIHNREYYRDSTPRAPGWSPTAPAVQWLIIVTVATFVLQLVFAQPNRGIFPIDDWFSVDPQEVLHGQVWRLLTYAFLHNRYDLTHLLFNMLALWWFGRTIEQIYGSREFLWFYLLSAAIGGVGFTLWALFDQNLARAEGASGAVMAVFMLFARHYPREKVYLFGLIGIEARWLVWLYVLFDLHPLLLELSTGERLTHIAHVIHLSGLAFGWAYHRNGWRLSTVWSRMWDAVRLQWRRHTSGRTLKVFRPDVEEDTINLDDEVDRILAKIHEYGSESLTPRERSLLTKASERYKRKE